MHKVFENAQALFRRRPVVWYSSRTTRSSIATWLQDARYRASDFLFPSRVKSNQHLSTRQYSRLVHKWVELSGLNSNSYGTHSMRRTKVVHIYRKTGNLRAVQLLLGHTKLETTVRYLGVEVEDALSISEQLEL